MPYRKEKFANGEIYHIVLRAIDENIIFKNVDDHYRSIFSIYEFNDKKPVVIRDRRSARSRIKRILRKTNRVIKPKIIDARDKLVDILAFCLMPNHIHLLLRQITNGGVIKFMGKFGTGYGGYFNKKYGRKGHVFQSRFREVRIKTNKQLKIAWAYIHANPVSLVESRWKEKGIYNFRKAIRFLEKYKWSSYLDYIGSVNFPSVTEREFILQTIGGKYACKELLEDYLKYRGNIKDLPDITIE